MSTKTITPDIATSERSPAEPATVGPPATPSTPATPAEAATATGPGHTGDEFPFESPEFGVGGFFPHLDAPRDD